MIDERPSRKSRITWSIIFCSIGLISGLFSWILCEAIGGHDGPRTGTRTNPAFLMAAYAEGWQVAPSGEEMRRYQLELDELAGMYRGDPGSFSRQILDECAYLGGRGIDVHPSSIPDAAIELAALRRRRDHSKDKADLAEFITAYDELRLSGRTHEQTIDAMIGREKLRPRAD